MHRHIRNTQNPMKLRGFTLIEMVAVMTTATVLMGVAVVLLASLMGAEWGGRERFVRNNSLNALAEQFRRDVHAAVDSPAASVDQRDVWDIPLATDGFSHYVRYRADSDSITRAEHTSDGAARRETYLLPDDCDVSIATEETGERRLVRLAISARKESQADGRQIVIEALLGLDRRFSNRAEASVE